MSLTISPDQYARFNAAADNGAVLWQWSKRGFGSELVTMLAGMVYAAERGAQFRLCSRYGNIARRRGWRDYFLPFCPETANPLLARSYARKPHQLGARLLERCVGAELTHQVFPRVWTPSFLERRLTIAGLGAHDVTVFDLCRSLLAMVWRPTEATSCAIEQRLAGLRLSDSPFAALHIRRGDKYKEATESPVAAYFTALREASPDLRRVFISTDDYQIITTCRQQQPDLDIVTLCEPSRVGHLQRRFNALTRAERYTETLDLLADLAALRGAALFVGTYSSSIGRVLALFRGLETCRGVDGPFEWVR